MESKIILMYRTTFPDALAQGRFHQNQQEGQQRTLDQTGLAAALQALSISLITALVYVGTLESWVQVCSEYSSCTHILH
jgi:hypothetical protein